MKASRLDLPQPLGPITVVTSPGATVQVSGGISTRSPSRMKTPSRAQSARGHERGSRLTVESAPAKRRHGQQKWQQRQQRLHQGIEPDDAAIGAGGEADGLGRQGGEAAGAGEQRRQILGGADREADREGGQDRPPQHRQLDAPEHAVRRGAEAARRAGVALVEAAERVGQREEHIGQHEQQMAPDQPDPAAVQADRDQQDLQTEQERHLRHQQRRVDQPQPPVGDVQAVPLLVLQAAEGEPERAEGGGRAERGRGPDERAERAGMMPPPHERPFGREHGRIAPALGDRPERIGGQGGHRERHQEEHRRRQPRS